MTNTLRAGLLAFLGLLTWPALAQKSSEPILIGQSAGLTGGQSGYSADVRAGLEAYFSHVNKNGGVNGRPLKLLAEDDGGKKKNVLANTRKLVETDRVIALIGYTSGAGVEESLDYLDSIKVPMLAPMTGNMGIRASMHRNLFHTRAGYDAEMRKVIGNMAMMGLKRFGLVYLDDVGPGNAKAMHDALKANQLTAVAEAPVSRNSLDFTSAVDHLLKGRPEVVVFITNNVPLVKIVQGMRAKGYGGQFITSSFAGIKVVEDLKDKAPGLILSEVLPHPQRTQFKLVKEHHQVLKDYAPDAKANYTTLEAHVAAKVLVEGLRRAGNNLTPERLVDALEDIRKLDLGGYEVSFSPKSRDGSVYVNTGVVSQEGALRF
jgi:ABC-type branched-subunit amino acid transport system substrate-binding protein